MEEDKERSEVEKRVKSPLLAKLALIAALFPRNEVGAALAVESIVHCGGGTRYSSEESDASQQHPRSRIKFNSSNNVDESKAFSKKVLLGTTIIDHVRTE